MRKKSKQIVPQYIQDISTGTFGEVSDYEGNTYFAYFINPITGWASGNRGSIFFEKDDEEIKFLNEMQCNKLFLKLKELKEKNGSMIQKRVTA